MVPITGTCPAPAPQALWRHRPPASWLKPHLGHAGIDNVAHALRAVVRQRRLRKVRNRVGEQIGGNVAHLRTAGGRWEMVVGRSRGRMGAEAWLWILQLFQPTTHSTMTKAGRHAQPSHIGP